MAGDNIAVSTALLTEHLGYTPLSLIDDVINSVNTIIYHGIDSLEVGLVSIPPERLGFKKLKEAAVNSQDNEDDNGAKHELEEGLHKFETLMAASIDKRFDIFEIYTLRNILSMPLELIKWVRLSHYEDIPQSQTQSVPSTETIEQLRRRLVATRHTTHRLTTEVNRNEALLKQLRSVVGEEAASKSLPNMSFLASNVVNQPFSGQQPIATNVQFTASQLSALKSSVVELKDRLASLKNTQTGPSTANQERREERRQYIEQRTRAHLERNGHGSDRNDYPFADTAVSTTNLEAMNNAAGLFNPP